MFGYRQRQAGAVMSAVLLTTVIASCTNTATTSSSGTPVQGGTITVGQIQAPNWIFPFVDGAHARVLNAGGFQYFMYRPLYFFGLNGRAQINYPVSPGDPPKFSNGNQTVTVHLKNWKWSDGTNVSPRNVAFWMGLDFSMKTKLAGYAPGFIPDDIASVSYDDAGNNVTFNLKSSIAPNYFLNNELLQIVPLPEAWDLTAAGVRGQCSSEDLTQQMASCPAVYNYLVSLAKDLNSYATKSGPSAIWQVVDGPWKLSTFNADGHVTWVPNPSYSGPTKPHVDKFQYLPFTDGSAEENVLRANTSISIGMMPTGDLPQKSPGQAVGPNPLAPRYNLPPPTPFWGVSHWFVNFNNSQAGPLFKQLYMRQALQSVMDQKTDIQVAYRGYSSPTYGPIPSSYPGYENQRELYPFDINTAKKYLTSNGWSVPASGPATCSRPGTGAGECGAGVRAGATAEFTLETFGGDRAVDEIVQEFKSDAAKAGIEISVKVVDGPTTVADATRCQPADASCNWQIINWGATSYRGGYPVNASLFGTTGALNRGSFNDPTVNSLIDEAVHSSSPDALKKYSDYLSQQLPVIFWPVPTPTIPAVVSNLRGVQVNGPSGTSTPEEWYFVR